MFGHTKGNPLLANDVSFQILFVRLRSEHIQAVGKPVKIILGAIMAYSFRISSSLTEKEGAVLAHALRAEHNFGAHTSLVDALTHREPKFCEKGCATAPPPPV